MFILVVSGGIAYLADRVGMKIGKKKLKLGNLRPRQVASIGTVLIGVFVSLISLGGVLLFSTD